MMVNQYKLSSVEVYETAAEPVKYMRPPLPVSELDDIQYGILALMEEEKLYRTPEVKLEYLASMLSIPKQKLTQVLNEYMKTSFYEILHSYRLKDFKRRLAEDSKMEYTLLGHAFDSGFQSKSSFNKLFKEYCGITPSQYRKQLFMEMA